MDLKLLYLTLIPGESGGPLTSEHEMAKNKPVGDGARVGAVRARSQVFNPQNQIWTKRDAVTGRFMDQKADPDPFKGIRKEKRK